MSSSHSIAILECISQRIKERLREVASSSRSSYVASLAKRGKGHMARKVGEEAVELVVAALEDDKKAIVEESADLLFHWLVLMEATGTDPQEVYGELDRRFRPFHP